MYVGEKKSAPREVEKLHAIHGWTVQGGIVPENMPHSQYNFGERRGGGGEGEKTKRKT